MRNIRRRKRAVNIQITCCSWIVEAVAGNVLIFTLYKFEPVSPWIVRFYYITMFVIVPATYVINRDVTKEKILTSSWKQGIRSIFLTEKRIVPSKQQNEIPINNAASGSKQVPPVKSSKTDKKGLTKSRHTTDLPRPRLKKLAVDETEVAKSGQIQSNLSNEIQSLSDNAIENLEESSGNIAC